MAINTEPVAILRAIVWKLSHNHTSGDCTKSEPAKVDRNDIVIRDAQEYLDKLANV
jgi:hypothetical protein